MKLFLLITFSTLSNTINWDCRTPPFQENSNQIGKFCLYDKGGLELLKTSKFRFEISLGLEIAAQDRSKLTHLVN